MSAPSPSTAPTTAGSLPDFSLDTVEKSLQGWLTIPHQWPSSQDLLGWCSSMGPGTAVILLAAGFMCLLWGQSMFKLLVSMNCAIVGAWIGGWVGSRAGAIVPGVLIGGFMAGALSFPAMKHCISLLAAVVGFVIGCVVWRTLGLEARFAPAGGLIGLTFLFMLSFIKLRPTIILATGIQGAAMLILGTVGLLYKYHEIAPRMDSMFGSYQYLLPTAVFVPAMLGFIYQYSTPPAAPPAKK
ncbi:MAG: hypothetical protein QM770_24350 [Tepidisphaeraceae bacterium]